MSKTFKVAMALSISGAIILIALLVFQPTALLYNSYSIFQIHNLVEISKHDDNEKSNSNHSNDDDYDDEILSKTFTSVSSLDIRLRQSTCKIKVDPMLKNNEIRINYNAPNNWLLEQDGEVLHIKQNNSNWFLSIFRFPFTKFNSAPKHTILISVSAEQQLQSFELLGSIAELDIDDLNMKHGKIELNMGSIEIDDSKLKDTDITMNLGNLEIDDSELEQLRVSIDLGDIESSGLYYGQNSFYIDMGSISLAAPSDLLEYYKVNYSVDMGKISSSNAISYGSSLNHEAEEKKEDTDNAEAKDNDSKNNAALEKAKETSIELNVSMGDIEILPYSEK